MYWRGAVENVKRNVDTLKDDKSPENDGLLSEFFKAFKEDISEFLSFVFIEAMTRLNYLYTKAFISEILDLFGIGR